MELEIFYRYSASLGLLYMAFTLYVIRMRWKHRVGIGHGENKEMTKAIRIHGNFGEYIPFLLLLTYFTIQKGNLAVLGIHIFMSLLIISRILHFLGLSKSIGTSFGRATSTTIIFISFIFICFNLLR